MVGKATWILESRENSVVEESVEKFHELKLSIVKRCGI